jgi:uncharacterized protein
MSSTKQKSDKPLIIFFILSLGLVFLLASFGIAENYGVLDLNIPIIPFLVIGSWTPNIAAILVLMFIIRKPGGVRNLFSRWTMWKESSFWYLMALSPLLVAGIGAILYHIFDGAPPETTDAVTIPMLLSLLFLSLITGAMGEELGWRGFALPRLQVRVNALTASIVVGVIWGFWHLPLWFTGLGWEDMSFWLFTYNCVAISVVMTWVCNNTKGNMVIITLLHLFYNFGWNLMSMTWGVPIEKSLSYQAIALTVYVVIVLSIYGPAKLTRKETLPIDQHNKAWININE